MITEAHFAAPEEIMALLDGELPPQRAQAVSVHVAECAECREVAEILRNGSLTVSNWTVSVAPPNAEFEKRLAEAAGKLPARGRVPGFRRWSAFPTAPLDDHCGCDSVSAGHCSYYISASG
jgi:anti-sigma factor RsiW